MRPCPAATGEFPAGYRGGVSEDHTTWIVLFRDVSDTVRVRGERRTAVAIVLDAATGLVVTAQFGTSRTSVLERALKDALIRPAAPLPKVVPGRVVCPAEILEAVEGAASSLSRLASTSIVEGVELWDAEEIFDGLVGHLEGRSQPEDPPSVGDWRLLYAALEAYVAAAPWQRWTDSDYLALRLELDGRTVERTAIVLGSAGVQRGFNLTADSDSLQRAATEGGDPLTSLEGAFVVHLNSWRGVSGVFALKARRYGWDDDATLVPQLFTVRDGEPADLNRDDSRLLALALRGVVAWDSRPLGVVGDAAAAGTLTFDGGAVGRYEVASS